MVILCYCVGFIAAILLFRNIFFLSLILRRSFYVLCFMLQLKQLRFLQQSSSVLHTASSFNPW